MRFIRHLLKDDEGLTTPLLRLILTAIGMLFLVCVWRLNYNLIGDFFDYSIISSAAGQLHAGLKPYRDFTTPLQSLTLYLGSGAEWVFGRRYLALAYGNLTLGIAAYIILLRVLKNRLPFLPGLAAVVALVTATFFQHGILWYNPIALLLSTLILWTCALVYREKAFPTSRIIFLCLLLYLSSMCKLNFHLLNIGFIGLIFTGLTFRLAVGERKKLLWIVPTLLFFGIILGSLTEVLANGTTFHDFYENVFVTPRGRLDLLSGIWKPGNFFDTVWDYYPDNTDYGLYLKGAIIYGAWIFLSLVNTEKSGSKTARNPTLKYFVAFISLVMFVSSLLLTLTNKETPILTGSFLLVGLVAIFLMFAPDLTHLQSTVLKTGIVFLSAYFLIAGTVAAARHSRIRYMETASYGSELQKEHEHFATSKPSPTFTAEETSPTVTNYFADVRFTEHAHRQLQKITAFMAQPGLLAHPEKIYWGPGLQILNRVYGETPRGHLPLWYDLNVSVRNEDSPRIIAAFKQNDFEWIVVGVWLSELPTQIRSYLIDNYSETVQDDLIFYRKKS